MALARLDIANIIQDALKDHFKVGELISHGGAVTMDFDTPEGGNFVITLNISRGEYL